MKIVVDTNIVFSAMLNTHGDFAKILLLANQKYTFYSSQILQEEIIRHKEKLISLSGYSKKDFEKVYSLLMGKIKLINPLLVPENSYIKAFELTKDVDEDDTAFIALTDYIKARLWTGDKKLKKGLEEKGWNKFILTEQLLTGIHLI